MVSGQAKHRAAHILSGLILCAAARGAPPVTFNRDIAPILYTKCAPCHRPGESGPFSLLSYSDAKSHDARIAAVTRSRSMPPWLPEAGYGEFREERRLTAAEIREIGEWVREGAPEGPPAEAPRPPSFVAGWQLGTPDLVLEASSSYETPASGRDVYWNFVFRLPIRRRRYVRAVEIRPGHGHLIHHANLLIDRLGTAHLKEVAPGHGFPGMDLTILRSPFDPAGHFLFWKPGSPPPVEPNGFAFRLDPGNELVLNTHIHPSGKPEVVRPSIGLYFTDQPETHFPLLLRLEDDQDLDIPPGDADFQIRDDFRLPMDVDVLAVYPHAHYLGKLLEAYATLPGGGKKWLIRIPDWDPNWQAVYTYREPLFLPKGSVISMRYHYDNSARNPRNPNSPPQRVRAGNQSTDEMGHLWLQVLPRGAGDRRRELQEALFEHRIGKNPNDFEANFNLGVVMLSRLDAAGAVSKLRTAARLEPSRADVRNTLGLALAATGRSAEAIGEYEAALRIDPGYTSARFNLANALVKTGRLEEAIADYRRVVQAAPADPLPKARLAAALQQRARKSGEKQGAIR